MIFKNDSILAKLKSLYNLESDADLCRLLGVSKQSLHQYKNSDGVDIKTRIISAFIEKM